MFAAGLKGTSPSDSSESTAIAAFPLLDLDRHILSLTDEEYTPHSFDNLRELCQRNDLHLLTRFPTQLKRYIAWTAETKKAWTSMNNYLLHNRLNWYPLPTDTDPPLLAFELADKVPLKDERDYKILPNDWPYGLTPELRHVLVWLKHKLEVDDDRGDLTPESRTLVETFVRDRFGGEDKVVWWRNWTALQSVRGLDHVHVVVRGMSKDKLRDLTGEDGEDIPGKPPAIAATKPV